jgi:serine/threonine protein kinase
MSLAPQTALGPYTIVAPLGAGGMGEVYRASDQRLGRDVAVKVLPAALAGDADRLRRFENEARAAARLNHPNILQIYDVGNHAGHPYLVTELLEGETLRERLAGGPLSPRRAIEFAVGIAQGLAAAHDEGIVHRDLKPENLFLTKDGRVKILDFGLAKLTRPEGEGDEAVANAPTLGADTEAGVVMGTVGYMSPEQVRGQKADARSDIFAFGAILFETVSGQRAFRGDTPADTMSAILKEDPPELTLLAKEIPPAFDRIVHRCLEKSPARRFRSALDLAFSLEAISTTSATAASGGVPAGEGAGLSREVEFEQITHAPSFLLQARFAPDGQTVVYANRIDGGPPSLFMKRPETPEAIPIPVAGADLGAISPSGEMAVQLDPVAAHAGVGRGTLAVAPMFGGAPRPLAENITHVDFDPTGRALAVIREPAGKSCLEYPMGNVLYETIGHVSYVRVSPRGDRIAFLDHPMKNDDRSSVAVIDLEGAKKTLTPEWASAQGLAWTPDGDEIWFAATKGGAFRSSVYGVSLSGELRQVYAALGSIRIFDIAKNGSAVLSRESYTNGIVYSGHGDAPERELGWLGYSLPAALSDDGRTILFTEQSHSIGRDYAVCIRGTDGSPVIRLGEGTGLALSPDGRWALSHLPYRDAPFELLPTGPGRKRTFPSRGYQVVGHRARFTHDGTQIVMAAHDENAVPGILVLSVDDGALKFLPVTGAIADLRPSFAVSPDGREALVGHVESGETQIVPLDGAPSRPGPRLAPHDIIAAYAPDGAALYVQTGPRRIPLVAVRVDLASGAREPWLEFMPANRAGLVGMSTVLLSRDGSVFACGCARHVADLFVARGLA